MTNKQNSNLSSLCSLRPVPPMLALTRNSVEEFPLSQFPLLCQQKFDGVRALHRYGEGFYSRSLREFANKELMQQKFANVFSREVAGDVVLDGELVRFVGNGTPNDPVHFLDAREVTSVVNSIDMPLPQLAYIVFDVIPNMARMPQISAALDRFGMFAQTPFPEQACIRREFTHFIPLHHRPLMVGKICLFIAPTFVAQTPDELMMYFHLADAAGWEGLMMRPMESPYLHKRATRRNPSLLRYKPFETGYAVIVDFVEEMANENPQELDNLGYAKRSSHADNLVGKGTLGAFVCELTTGEIFNIGTGMTKAFRQEVWNNRSDYRNRLIKFKYQAHGTYKLPRSPVFLDIWS